MPPEPARFSTTNCWPRWSESHSLRIRATMSFGPPAVNPTTKCTGRMGYFSPAAARSTANRHWHAKPSRMTRERTPICPLLPRLHDVLLASGEPCTAQNRDHSFDRYARGFYHLRPLFGFVDADLTEVRRCSGHDDAPEVGETRLDIRIRKRRVDCLVELVDDLRRRFLWRPHAKPRTGLIARHGIGHSRYIGKCRRALRRRYAKRAQLARSDVFD